MSKEFDPRVSASIDLHGDDDNVTEVYASQTSAEQDMLLREGMDYRGILNHRNRFWNAACYSAAGHTVMVIMLGTLWSILVHYYGPKYDYGVSLISSPLSSRTEIIVVITANSSLGPARDAVNYERVTLDTNIYEQSDFIGQPRPEMDAAWDGLLKCEFCTSILKVAWSLTEAFGYIDQYQAVQPSEFAGEQSVGINDVTERLLIQLEAYHTLDCLNFVRKFAFRTYYNMTDSMANVQRFGQCLDRVRQTTMCYGDVSVSTYVWREGHLMPFPNFRLAHECRDWGSIEQWAEEHKLPPLGDELLNHPTYGKIVMIANFI